MENALSRTPAGQPYATLQSAKNAVPKTKRKGQTVFVKDAETKYTFTPSGELVPANATELTVEFFRQSGTTDTEVLEKAFAAMREMGRPLIIGRNPTSLDGSYYIETDTIFIPDGYFELIGKGKARIAAAKKACILEPTAPNSTYPSPTSVGPCIGTGLYFTSGGNSRRIEGVEFSDFNFAITDLLPIDGASFINCIFTYNCIGVFCYTSMQNYTFTNCGVAASGALCVFTATAFTAGSPFKGWETFGDGLLVSNGENGGYNGHSCISYPYFNDYFISSILRPAERSFSAPASNPNGYIYPYPADHEYCRVTGRVFTAPMRGERDLHGITLKGTIDSRGNNPLGYALLNGGVYGLTIQDNWVIEGGYEGEGATKEPAVGWITIGSSKGGRVNIQHPKANGRSIVGYTRRGENGDNQLWGKLNFQWPNYTGNNFLDEPLRNVLNRLWIGYTLGQGLEDKIVLDDYNRRVDTREVISLVGCVLYVWNNETGETLVVDCSGLQVQGSLGGMQIYTKQVPPGWQDKCFAVLVFGPDSKTPEEQRNR